MCSILSRRLFVISCFQSITFFSVKAAEGDISKTHIGNNVQNFGKI